MERKDHAVKPKRGYNSAGRQAQARRSQLAILETAERLFISGGYAPTTVAAIAKEAEVSVETIYKAFGGKPGLIRGIREIRLTGGGTPSAERRSNQMRVRESDPHKIVANWGRLSAEVAPSVWPLISLIREAAASDPELFSMLDELASARHQRMLLNASHLYEAGHLRPGVSLSEATDVLWAYSSPELYELLVLRRGWNTERFGRFVAEAISAALLRD